jgi:rubrerythrin
MSTTILWLAVGATGVFVIMRIMTGEALWRYKIDIAFRAMMDSARIRLRWRRQHRDRDPLYDRKMRIVYTNEATGWEWTCRHCGHVNRGTDSSAFCEKCETPR